MFSFCQVLPGEEMVLSASLLEILLGNLPFCNYLGVGNILKNISWEYFVGNILKTISWEYFENNFCEGSL